MPSAFHLAGLAIAGRKHAPTTRSQRSHAPSSPSLPDTASAEVRPRVQVLSRATSSRSSRSRNPGYFNAFQTACHVSTDDPPCYALAARSSAPVFEQPEAPGVLPGYSCTVSFEAKCLLNLENVSPLSPLQPGEWREVFVVLRGTMLSFHRLRDGRAGRLLRSYTLQHAEVGMAPDVDHCVLSPQNRIAHLVPQAARRRAWQKDPDLFREVKQSVLRLRAETHQIVLADSEEERVHSLLQALAAAIDISQPIDDRSVPRQCTVPRRRRLQHRLHFHGDLNDPVLVAEQRRILNQDFPRLAQASRNAEAPDPIVTTPSAREDEEIDFSMIREEAPQSPDGPHLSVTRTMTNSTLNSTFSQDMIYLSPSPSDFSPDGKWQPPHTRSPSQFRRYIKRCLPILLADAPRASDILIHEGRRVRINRQTELLEPWDLSPPSYRAHGFKDDRAVLPPSPSATTRLIDSASSEEGEDDRISSATATAAAEAVAVRTQLPPRKVLFSASAGPNPATLRAMAELDPKGRSPSQIAREIQGVVFCL